MSGSALGAYAPSHVSTPALFGRVMGLVALTVGFATLGVWLGRDSGGAAWFIAWLLAIGCLIGLNVANARGNTGLALVLLFAFGLLLGWSVATTVNYYAETDPTALRQAFGATALSVAALGAGGYAVRRDLSFLYRILFWLLLGADRRRDRADLRPHPGGLHGLVGARAGDLRGSTPSWTSTACGGRARTRRSRSPPGSSSTSSTSSCSSCSSSAGPEAEEARAGRSHRAIVGDPRGRQSLSRPTSSPARRSIATTTPSSSTSSWPSAISIP